MSPPAWGRKIIFFRDPYRFAARRKRELGGRGFRTRLLLQKGAFLAGGEGVARLYEPDLLMSVMG